MIWFLQLYLHRPHYWLSLQDDGGSAAIASTEDVKGRPWFTFPGIQCGDSFYLTRRSTHNSNDPIVTIPSWGGIGIRAELRRREVVNGSHGWGDTGGQGRAHSRSSGGHSSKGQSVYDGKFPFTLISVDTGGHIAFPHAKLPLPVIFEEFVITIPQGAATLGSKSRFSVMK